MTEENHELRPMVDMDMATLMEDVGSESRSQNRLQGANIDDPAHEKEGTMAILERPGIPGEAHCSGCSYHKRTVSIMVTVNSVSCNFNVF